MTSTGSVRFLALAAVLAFPLAGWAGGTSVRGTLGNTDGLHGFGRLTTGGRDGQRVVVDTTTWLGPDDVGFDVSDCDEVGGDACAFAEAVCQGNRYVTFRVSGQIEIADTRAGDGADSSNFELADCPTANQPIKNLTVDFETAPGAGVYLSGMDFTLDGPTGGYAENLLLKGFRHRGSDSAAVALSSGLSMSGCVRCATIRSSIVYPMTYTLFVGGNLYGHANERNRDVTFQQGLHAYSHVLGEHQGASATDKFSGAGTCSGERSRSCCIDGDNAAPLHAGECRGAQTCNGEAATCRLMKTPGRFFSLYGASTSPDEGDTCNLDWDGAYGLCSAFCEGYGADAGKRAGLEAEHGGFMRQYSNDEGICEGGSAPGTPCSSACPGGGICRKECGAGTYATGPWLTSGMDNYGTFISGNVGNISYLRNLVLGHRWRCPNLGPDTCTGDGCSTADESMAGAYDIAQNWCFGGKWMSDTWTEYSSRDATIVYSRNAHEINASTNTLYSDFWSAAGLPLADTTASFAALVGNDPNIGPNTRYYFDDNLDRWHSVGSEACYRGSGCGTSQSYSWSCGNTAGGCRNVPGRDGSASLGFHGQRGPVSSVPPWPGSFSALRKLMVDEAGATLPCRDAVDRYIAQLFDAGVAFRVMHSMDEVGGRQQDMSVCPDVVTAWTPSAQSKIDGSAVNVPAGAGIQSTTATVSTTETRMLKLHAWIESPGRVKARIRDPRVSAGTATFDFDVGSSGRALPNGCYPFTYGLSIGDYPKRAVGTIEVDVGGSSC